MSISHRSGVRRPERLISLKRLFRIEIGKYIQFLAEHCKDYQLYQEIVQIKVVEN